LSPILIITLFLGAVLYERIKSGSPQSAKNKLICIVNITFFLLYPDIVCTIFRTFSCVTLDDGSQRLFQDMDVQCWQGTHMDIIKKISLPSFVWILGIPFIIWKQLKASKNTVKLMSKSDEEKASFTK